MQAKRTPAERLAERQAVRELFREFRHPERWGLWWNADVHDYGPGTRPAWPPVHRVATDRCEQQQADGSWRVMPEDQQCAQCQERTAAQAAVEAARRAEAAAARAEFARLVSSPPSRPAPPRPAPPLLPRPAPPAREGTTVAWCCETCGTYQSAWVWRDVPITCAQCGQRHVWRWDEHGPRPRGGGGGRCE